MTSQDSDHSNPTGQSQDVSIGRDLQVSGSSNRLDFSQTTIDQSHAQISHTQIVQVAFDQVKTRPLNPRSPYIGLRKFEVRDRDLFFGRDRSIAVLQERLQDHFLLVLGASGSGKSSLIRAGLIAKLAEQRGSGFRELISTPDRNPFESFRASLIHAGYHQSDTDFLQGAQPNGLVQAGRTLKHPEDEWLVFVDQFEELFTLCANAQLRQHFIEALVNLVQAKLPAIDVIVAMRADFLDRLSAYPILRGILQRSELLTDLGDDELHLAIEQPAAHHGVVFEPGLVSEIIQDLKGHTETGETERVSLPLLQYTLKLLWESSSDLGDRILRTHTYRSLGGVRGALQRRVDQIYQGLSAEDQQVAKHIFLHLVDTTTADVGTTAVGKAVSRRAALGDFQAPAEQKVLTQLINASLLISDRPSSESGAIVELAHETLIDSWDTLKGWIEESKPLIRLRNQLKDDASRWYELHQQDNRQAEAELWQGSKLQRLLADRGELIARFGELKAEEVAFTEACTRLADRERCREVRQLRQKLAISVVALLAVGGIATIAMREWLRAEEGQIKALTQATAAEFIANRDSLDPLLTALEAGRQLQSIPTFLRSPELTADVLTALAQGVYWVREENRLEDHTNIIEAVTFSPDGQTIATASHDKTVKLWSQDKSGKWQSSDLPHDVAVISIDFHPEGRLLASGDYEGYIHLWQLQNGVASLISFTLGHEDFIRSLKFNSKGTKLASASNSGIVKAWTLESDSEDKISLENNLVQVSIDSRVRDIDFRHDDTVLAIVGDDSIIRLWDTSVNQEPALLPPGATESFGVSNIRFLEDGERIVLGSDDGKVRIWSNEDQIFESELASANVRPVSSIEVDRNSKSISAGYESGGIEVWDYQGNLQATLQGHSLPVYGMDFTPDGHVLASVSQDGTLKLWHTSHYPRLSILPSPDHIFGIDAKPDLSLVAATLENGQVVAWDLTAPTNPIMETLANDSKGRGIKINFNHQGDQLASTNLDGQVQIWTFAENNTIESYRKFTADSTGVLGVGFNPQGSILASGGNSSTVNLWDVSSSTHLPQLLTALEGHRRSITRLAFDSEGTTLASTGYDGTAIVWRATSDTNFTKYRRIPLVGHTGPAWGIAFDPLDDWIATSGADNLIKLSDQNGNLIRVLEGHNGSVNGLEFSPCGEFIYSASDDRTIKVWSRNGTLLVTLLGHDGGIEDIRLKPEHPDTLLSGSTDGRVIMWRNLDRLSLDELMKQGCDWVREYLLLTNNSELSRLCH